METKECNYCKLEIPKEAIRCHHCYSNLEVSDGLSISKDNLIFFKVIAVILAGLLGLFGWKVTGLTIDVNKQLSEIQNNANHVKLNIRALENELVTSLNELEEREKEIQRLEAFTGDINIISDTLFQHAEFTGTLDETIDPVISKEYSSRYKNIEVKVRINDEYKKKNNVIGGYLYFGPKQGMPYRFNRLDPDFGYQSTFGILRPTGFTVVLRIKELDGSEKLRFRRMSVDLSASEKDKVK